MSCPEYRCGIEEAPCPAGTFRDFRADRAWLYVVMLTTGYVVSRGLGRRGSRKSYDA